MSNLSQVDLVEQVVEVTGASEAEAQHLLSACANDVESAVALYFEQGGGEVADAVPTAAAIPVDNANDEESKVRAPIAPIREQLLGPEDDNFFSAAPSGRLARVPQRVKICPLRDFAREGALMEEQMQAEASGSAAYPADNVGPSNSNHIRRRRRAAAMVNAAQSADSKPSSSRLGDLFRPPTDITYAGTFQAARNRATDRKRWLLVNVQSDNFDSQLLNRDVWSDKELRKLIKLQFLLWQVDSESSEGRRFVAFYHCNKLPYVCLIDPRTGEEVWRSAELKQLNLLPELTKFLQEHEDFSREDEMVDEAPSTSTSIKRTECTTISDDDDDIELVNGTTKKRTKLLELSEEEQIALAIRNSMRENGDKAASSSSALNGYENDDGGSDIDSVEEFIDDDTKSVCERTSYELKLGSSKDELTTLKLRLFNADNADELVQLRWPSDTLLQVLHHYIAQQHTHIPQRSGYKLICAFPRKTLEVKHDTCTLKELGLHPSANLHLTLDD